MNDNPGEMKEPENRDAVSQTIESAREMNNARVACANWPAD